LAGEPLAAIVSAGLSKFGKLEGMLSREIFTQAFREAVDRCPNLDPRRDIDSIYIGQMSEFFEHQSHTGPLIADYTGLLGKSASRIESACASSGACLRIGVQAVKSGMSDMVLVGGVEKMTHLGIADVTEYLAMPSDYPLEQLNGLTFPGLFALMATAHIHRYGTTEEQMSLVAVKNHRNGAKNPKAHMQREITLEQALSSRVVAWPLKLFDCSLVSDGASCLVLTRPEMARKFTDTPVYIVGSAQASDTLGLYERDDLAASHAARAAAERAYKMAHLEPKDISLAEVHDCFTIAELMAYESLGFCRPGESGKFIQDGNTEIGGRIPVNTSGGLKSKGHPVGATGTAQAYEIYLQLIGAAEKRQIESANVGLTHNVGGSASTAVVHIYKRGD